MQMKTILVVCLAMLLLVGCGGAPEPKAEPKVAEKIEPKPVQPQVVEEPVKEVQSEPEVVPGPADEEADQIEAELPQLEDIEGDLNISEIDQVDEGLSDIENFEFD